ncbi:type I addiction module toxin, SymE family [Klebsiella huaxiensis]|uniref:SymE family type I addiction module toxin n=1 Tax=Klebsiella huaxiensis TaxID=2153354 RepID=A0ABT6EKI9_9ENTR|nr:SymE family type I addiction module toxin [Klebsiella huaxiensis]MDG1645346.1 SymE family type I addiction module toxin [Klebsiella huaxiensis]QBG06467.1 type I addiction module toxin, SymE family [Klebsiella huaxiensis]VUS90298.1 hypothetical protein SB6421_04181 [Klebsiella huaxiensis]
MTRKTTKTQQRYIVDYLPNRDDTSTSSLSLSGKWPKEAGFDTGRGVTISIAGDCIVLIPDNDEVYELRTQLKQVKGDIKVMTVGELNLL